MTYTVTKTTVTYNRFGAEIESKRIVSVLFASDSIAEVFLWQHYSAPKTQWSWTKTTSERINICRDGEVIYFGDVFLALEGQERYDMVMDDRLPSQDAVSYAAKLLEETNA